MVKTLFGLDKHYDGPFGLGNYNGSKYFLGLGKYK